MVAADRRLVRGGRAVRRRRPARRRSSTARTWHHAGRRANKQNVFDDFLAAADWLVDDGLAAPRAPGHARPARNGGLLVGAALTQRPDLCRAVWCGVPLLDMVRFPQFLIARLWTDEYGDPDVAEEFAWLHAYSPYHRVATGRAYPAVLFTTAEGDTRVDPLHARKMAALLQAASAATSGRCCCARKAAPATASASRSPSAPTSWPTCWRSSAGSSAARLTVRVEWLTVGGPVDPWQRLGLTVVDGTVPLFGTGIRIDESLEPGLRRWELSGLVDQSPTSTGC